MTVLSVSHPAPSMLQALRRVLSPIGFPYGSNGHLFKEAYFGRDSLEVAEDLLTIRPDIARTVVLVLAALQGTVLTPRTEEEPGKIPHEHRALVMDGHPISAQSREIFQRLARYWGMADTPEELASLAELTTYYTVDATPLYVRLIAAYVERYGPDLLALEYAPLYHRHAGHTETVRESVRRAIDWIASHLERSDLGLLEFQRMTPAGHVFQAWKDGGTSYIHPDGHLANYNAPIASIEVQGLAYDALTAAPSLLPDAGAGERKRWVDLAARLQQGTLARFWMPEERYFAMAIDRDPTTGQARQMQLISSNPGALLDSGIFDTLDPAARQTYIEAVAARLFSPEFLTPVGIRTTSTVHKDIQKYPAYQSSYTVWHKETYDTAKGLRRQGFERLAEDLETRLLNAVNMTGGATEFLYVFPDNRVHYDPLDPERQEGAEEIVATNVPENDQAWTISAALAIKWRRGHPGPAPAAAASWQSDLQERLLREAVPARLLRTRKEIQQAREGRTLFWINRKAGWQLERTYISGERR